MSTIRDDHQPISIQEIELESEMRSYYEMMTSSAKSSLDDLRMKLAEASNNYFAFIEVCYVKYFFFNKSCPLVRTLLLLMLLLHNKT